MLDSRIRTPEVETLVRALAAVTDVDDTYALLQDLCTVREIQDMAQRLIVAKMLACGDHYSEIQEKTGISATTISRVSKALNYGADGYLIGLRAIGEDPESLAAEGQPEE